MHCHGMKLCLASRMPALQIGINHQLHVASGYQAGGKQLMHLHVSRFHTRRKVAISVRPLNLKHEHEPISSSALHLLSLCSPGAEQADGGPGSPPGAG